MKTKSILAGALALAMFGACQKEAPVAEAPETQDASTVGYVAVNIKMPNTTATRANDKFNDGDENEYYVKNVTLVFYDDDGAYQWYTGVSTKWNEVGTAADNITSEASSGAIEVSDSDISKVLVLINAEGLGLDYTKSFPEFNTELVKTVGDIASTNNFFMSNAPIYDATKQTYTSLVDVELAKTEAEALASAATVQVERASAKVQLNYNASYTVGEEDDAKATVTFNGWALDITNKSFYPVRQCYATDWFTTEKNLVNNGLYSSTSERTYYAVDPNYDTEGTDAFNKVTSYTNQTEEVEYCLENTFDISNQRQDRTTRVLIEAVYTPTGFTTGETWYQVGTSKTIYSATDLEAYIVTTLKAHGKDVTSYTLPEAKGGSVTLKYEEDGDINALIGNVYCYANGICYYPVLIRHFNDAELGYTASNTFDTVYEQNQGAYSENDLGRYGVVRNNWYKLTVQSVSQPGSPDYPDPSEDNDDELEQFVACDIEILAWCLREQDVNL